MRKVLLTLVMVTLMVVAGSVAYAADLDTKTLGVQVVVSARGTLTITGGALSWADADPAVTPNFTKTITVQAQARVAAGSAVNVKVISGGDLTNGTPAQDIPITGLTWTSASAGFSATGTMDKTTAQLVATWNGSGDRSGTQLYSLPNSWSYATGTYTATLTYTMSNP